MGRHESHRSTVAALLDASWSLSPVMWPNDAFDPPAPANASSSPSAWLAVGIEVDGSERATFGGTIETRGRVVFTAWVEKDHGDGAARTMLDALVAIFEDTTSGGMHFDALFPGEPELVGDWYGLPAAVPFTEYREPS